MTLTGQPQPYIPSAIIVSGPAGAGKTTLGRALAARLKYALIDLDTVTGPLATLALDLLGAGTADFESPAGQRLRDLRYTTLLDVAKANLEVGSGVVLTAPFTREVHDEEAWSQVRACLRGVALIYLEAPAEVLRARLRGRDERRDDAKLRDGSRATAPSGTVVRDAIRVNAVLATEPQVEGVLRELSELYNTPTIVANGLLEC